MEDYTRVIQVDFHNMANNLFLEKYQAFRNDAARLDRDGDENVYQLLRSKYSQMLRQALEQRAGIFIERCEMQDMQHRLRSSLAETIRYFEAEFMRKAEEG